MLYRHEGLRTLGIAVLEYKTFSMGLKVLNIYQVLYSHSLLKFNDYNILIVIVSQYMRKLRELGTLPPSNTTATHNQFLSDSHLTRRGSSAAISRILNPTQDSLKNRNNSLPAPVLEVT